MDWKNELQNIRTAIDQKTVEKTLKKMVKAGILLKAGESPEGVPVYQPNKKFTDDIDKMTDDNWNQIWSKWKLNLAFDKEIDDDYKKLKKKYKKLKKNDLKKFMLFDLMNLRKEQKKDLSYIG